MLPGLNAVGLLVGGGSVEVIVEDAGNVGAGGGGTTHDFTGINVGAGETGKVLMLALSLENDDGSGAGPSVTVDPAGDNISMTLLAGTNDGSGRHARVFGAVIGSLGSTVTIRVSGSEIGHVGISTVALRNVDDAVTATFSGVDSGSDSSAAVASVTAAAGGIAMGAFVGDSSTASVTWSDLTEKADLADGSGNGRHAAAWAVYPSGRSASTETVTISASTSHALAVASIR